jgi:centromere protein J
VGHDGKLQRIYASGKKEVIFNNGVKRESFPDGYTIVYFNNKDIK